MAATSSCTHDKNEPEVSEAFLANMDKTVETIVSDNDWVKLQAVEASQAELEHAVRAEGLENDELTRVFTKFLSLATNFASTSFTDRLNSVPKVVQSIADFLEKMRQEIAEYAEIANQFEELIQVFGRLVMDTQHKMGLILPHMSEATDHLSVLGDVFESSVTTLTPTDQNDIQIALAGLLKGMHQMRDVSRTSANESRELAERINNLKSNVQKQHATVHGRIQLSTALSCLGPFAGAGVVARAVGALVTVEDFGGAGMFVIGTISLNPIAAIICGALLGGTVIITIAALVYRFWTRQQYRALEFLENICQGLMELSKANMLFLDYLNKSEEVSSKISTQLEQIQNTLTSERYRKHNAKLCKKAFDSVEEAVQAIEKIRNIDMSQWLTPKSLPVFSLQARSQPPAISQGQ